jgi:hypothetical protein
MSFHDEYARVAFDEVMANHQAHSPRSSGSGKRPGQVHREPSSSRRSGDVGSRRVQADIQDMAELQEAWSVSIVLARSDKILQNYSIVVEGFKILEAELQQAHKSLAAAQAENRPSHDGCKSKIENLTNELATCKQDLAKSQMVYYHIRRIQVT